MPPKGHWFPALGGFGFAMFAIVWAWINYSWFASAYDTDDWLYRVLTMVQMVGVLVLALGLPVMFESLDEGGTRRQRRDGGRLRRHAHRARAAVAARGEAAPGRPAGRAPVRRRARRVAGRMGAAAPAPGRAAAGVPGRARGHAVLRPRRDRGSPRGARGTPWHPRHIAERYGLFAIIALGEGVIGTIAAVSAVIGRQGWSQEAILLVIAGTGLTFGMWWCYFMIPSGPVLTRHRERSWVWGYSHAFLFASIVATGAGLHVAAYVLEGESAIGKVAAVLTVAVPVLIFGSGLFALYN